MTTLKKLLVGAVFAAACAGPVAAGLPGEIVTEEKFGFQVWVPLAWRYGKLNDMPYAHVAMQPPDAAESNAICIVGAEDIAITKGATQTQLNESLKLPVGRDFWKTQAFRAFESVEFESDGVRMHPTGVVVQEAIGSGPVTIQGKKVDKKMTSTLWITPGVTYTLVCSANKGRYEDYRTAFREVAETFRTKDTASAITAAVNPVPGPSATPVVLMHGSAGFGQVPAVLGAALAAPKFEVKK